jgi:transcriptional regulator with XRE-family HTH domain
MPKITHEINGRTLRKLMDENSMTPNQLAEKVGVNYSTIINWRKGTSTTGENIANLAEILDCKIKVLTAGKDPRVAATSNGGDEFSKISDLIQRGRLLCGEPLDKTTDRALGKKLGELITCFNEADKILTG